jgi:hypothetical protein
MVASIRSNTNVPNKLKEQERSTYDTSTAFHRRITFDFDVINAPITARHSFDFNCSSKLVMSRCLRAHRSISLNGPSDGYIKLKAMSNIVRPSHVACRPASAMVSLVAEDILKNVFYRCYP